MNITTGFDYAVFGDGPAMNGCDATWDGPARLRITMDEADTGIAPGQFGVLYEGEVCLGCGVID